VQYPYPGKTSIALENGAVVVAVEKFTEPTL
jgi:hypothetical protein